MTHASRGFSRSEHTLMTPLGDEMNARADLLLHVLCICLRVLYESDPLVIEHWRGEDAGGCRVGAHQVDAVVLARGGEPATAIECVGSDYSEDKLRSIQREWKGPYELW